MQLGGLLMRAEAEQCLSGLGVAADCPVQK